MYIVDKINCRNVKFDIRPVMPDGFVPEYVELASDSTMNSSDRKIQDIHLFSFAPFSLFAGTVCSTSSTPTSARALRRPAKKRNCFWCLGVQTGGSHMALCRVNSLITKEITCKKPSYLPELFSWGKRDKFLLAYKTCLHKAGGGGDSQISILECLSLI